MIAVNKVLEILEKNNLLIDSNIGNIENIEYLSFNSKYIKPNTMFFCKGIHFKFEYLTEAIKNGATIYVAKEKYDIDMPYIIVSDIQKSLALISTIFYGNPAEKLKLIGITGTKGKTTTVSFINCILNEYTKKKTAMVSSIRNYTGTTDEESNLTTPESIDLHRYFYEAYENNLEYLTMEISSQAYKTDRVLGIKYDYGMFLNIAEDHISEIEHPNFEDYLNCKIKLMKNCKTAIINKNMDVFNKVYNECTANNIITYGIDSTADYYYTNVIKEDKGFTFDVVNEKENYKKTFKINMFGRFNIENATAAVALAKTIGIDDESISRGLLNTIVLGRMNLFEKNGIKVIVDYAHNKLSFTKLYNSIKQDYPNSRIITVGGCVGGKAYNRRKEFGEIVGNNSDYIYLTNEDSQYEDVNDICKDIIKYFKDGVKYEIVVDRKEAIEKAILNAHSGDIIVTVGKGPEKWQRINGVCEPYESDAVVVEETFKQINNKE